MATSVGGLRERESSQRVTNGHRGGSRRNIALRLMCPRFLTRLREGQTSSAKCHGVSGKNYFCTASNGRIIVLWKAATRHWPLSLVKTRKLSSCCEGSAWPSGATRPRSLVT